MTRQETIDSIRARSEVSVLIVGGGINGAGLFRELALQGVDVLLVDKADFCAGASAASSHMIHGGLRYLENGEFRLVKEALRERNLLLLNAPHYVHPLPTVVPIFEWTAGMVNAVLKFLHLSRRPGKRGALLVRIGLTMYDLFARWQRTMPAHRFTSRAEALAQRSQLNPAIVCTATYYDARIDYPERLCLELILDTEAQSPQARAANYVRLESAAGEAVTLRDELSGETFQIKPRIVVNATGAWIDFTNRTLRSQQPTRYIGGTKGSHLVIDHPEFYEATRGEMLFYENADGRICLFFPYGGKVLAGSTDIPVDDPETVRCEDEEADYILAAIRLMLPSIRLNRSHVVFRYCGVRPLPASNAATPGQISRDHHVALDSPDEHVRFPIYSLIGGKWTTFRAFSEQVADQILAALQCPRRIQTRNLAIGGGKDYPRTPDERQRWLAALQEKTNLPSERLAVLLGRYGTRAEAVAVYLVAAPDQPLRYHPGYSQREIAFLVLHERVVHLDDLILRRTLLAMLGELSNDLLEELAALLATTLGWSEQERQAEIQRTLGILETKHGVTAQQLQARSVVVQGEATSAHI